MRYAKFVSFWCGLYEKKKKKKPIKMLYYNKFKCYITTNRNHTKGNFVDVSNRTINSKMSLCVIRNLSLILVCLVDLSSRINWMSPFPILGVSGVLFHCHFIFDRNSCTQTVKTLIRRRPFCGV